MKVRDIDFSEVLLDKKSYKNTKNVLIYDILYKNFIGAKPLRIRFDEIDESIKIYDESRYLVLFDHAWCDEIWHRIRYLISEKIGITDSINRHFRPKLVH